MSTGLIIRRLLTTSSRLPGTTSHHAAEACIVGGFQQHLHTSTSREVKLLSVHIKQVWPIPVLTMELLRRLYSDPLN